MAARGQASVWNAINDFRPGIHKNLSPAYPPGTAQETNTYRCYALPSGALAPLPITQTQTFTMDDPVSPATLQNEEFRVIGLHVVGPLFKSTNATYGTDQNNTEIFVAIEYWVSDTQWLEVYRYKRHYRTSPTWTKIWDNGGLAGTYSATARPANFVFSTSRSNNSAPTVSGPTVIVWAGAGYAQMFPDDTAPTVDGTHYLPGDKSDPANAGTLCSPDILVTHQGRTVIFPLTTLSFGADSLMPHNEAMYWTAFNDFRTRAPEITSYWNITVGPEHPVGYGCVASLSANELFLLKRSGGAYVVTGDVSGIGPSAPTSRQLPFVKSPGFALNNGTICPKGYAYCVDNGTVWLWTGGDFADNASAHLDDNFWRPTPETRDGATPSWGYQWTQSDCANNFVLIPNNWLWETSTDSWWRVDDSTLTPIYRWAVDWRYKKVYGCSTGFRGTPSTDPTVYEFDVATPASSYSWQSQPISTTIDKSVSVINVGIVASGKGAVTLTVSSRQDNVGRSRTFNFDNTDYPEMQQVSCGIRGTHITFRVEASASNAGEPAPTVHDIRYEIGAPLSV